MLYSGDIELVEKAVNKGFRDQDSSNAWDRIKKALEESCQLPTTGNKSEPSDIPASKGYRCPDCEQWGDKKWVLSHKCQR